MKKLHLLTVLLLSLHTSLFAAPQTYVHEAGDFSPANPTNGTTVTWKPGTPDAVAGLTFGSNAFTSIQSAINATNASGTVLIAAGTYDEGKEIKISRHMTLRGDGIGHTILTGGSNGDDILDPGEHSVLWVYGDINGDDVDRYYPVVTFEGLSIVDGVPPSHKNHGGGLTIHYAEIIVNGCWFSGHSFSAIFNAVSNSRFKTDRIRDPITRIYDSVITENKNIGLHNQLGQVAIIRTEISKSTGLGVLNEGDFYSFFSTISNCESGGIENSGGTDKKTYCNVFYSTINGNEGSGIFNVWGHMTIYASTITENIGGVLSMIGESLTISNCSIFGNIKDTMGGSVTLLGGQDVLIANSIIAGTSDSQETIPQANIIDVALHPDLQTDRPINLQLEGVNFIGNESVNTKGNSPGLNAFRPGTDLSFTSTGTTPADLLNPILANNGGPTSTLALVLGSPAINSGDKDFEDYLLPFYSFPSVGKTTYKFLAEAMFNTKGVEQRGPEYPRLLGGALDIGSVEASYPIRVSERSCSLPEKTINVIFNQEVSISDLSQVSLVNTETGAPIASTANLVGNTLIITSPTAFDEVIDVSILIGDHAVTNELGNSFGISDRATLTFLFTNAVVYVDQQKDFHPPNPAVGSSVIWNKGKENEVSGLTYGVNAFSSIQQAVDSICIAGNVFIAAGTYEEGKQIEIDKSISLQGDSASTTILSGNGVHRVIRTSGTGNEISIDNLTITGGLASGEGQAGSGGGIQNNEATLTVKNSTISDNHAPSENGGSGGGLTNLNGELHVYNSTFLNNSARLAGGGIASSTTSDGESSSLSVINSTFSGNKTVSPESSGWFNFNGGGAIFNLTLSSPESASLSVIHSTFAENSSLNGSGGGILNFGGEFELVNSIVLGNTTEPTNSERDIASSPAFDDENNLIGLPSGWSLAEVLGPLADNGGSTLTRMPVLGSPVIDAGDNSLVPAGITTDQRGNGFPRTLAAAVDLGAVEYLPAPTLVSSNPVAGSRGVALNGVITLTFDQTLQAGTGSITVHRSDNGTIIPTSVSISGENVSITPLTEYPEGLRFYIEIEPLALLNAAKTPFAGVTDPTQLAFITCVAESYVDAAGDFTPASPADDDTVTWNGTTNSVTGLTFGINAFDSVQDAIDSVCAGGTVYIAAGTYEEGKQLEIDKSVLLQGDAPATTILSGGDTHRVIRTTGAENTIYVDRLTISGGLDIGTGGEGAGGGIQNLHATLTITNSMISGNHATAGAIKWGGGISNQGGDVEVLSSTFQGNSATGAGGAICNLSSDSGRGGTIIVTNSTFSGNHTNSAYSTISIFYGGAAIYNFNGSGGAKTSVVVNNSTFVENSSVNGSGGGIKNIGGSLTVRNTIIVGNSGTLPSSNQDIDSTIAYVDESNLIGLPDGITLLEILGPLADNGGPTLTRRLTLGSPAIDAGNISLLPDGIDTDQRGAPRSIGALDIGAVELTPALIAAENTANYSVNLTTKIRIPDLLASVTGGAGLPLTLVSVSDPANTGSSIRISGSFIIYTPAPGQTTGDNFTYQIGDGFRTTQGTVQILHKGPSDGPTFNISSITLDGGAASIAVAGIPGSEYQLESSEDLDKWTPLGDSQICPPGGIMIFMDPGPLPGTRFYRAVGRLNTEL